MRKVYIDWRMHYSAGKGKWRKPGRGGRYRYGPKPHFTHKIIMKWAVVFPNTVQGAVEEGK